MDNYDSGTFSGGFIARNFYQGTEDFPGPKMKFRLCYSPHPNLPGSATEGMVYFSFAEDCPPDRMPRGPWPPELYYLPKEEILKWADAIREIDEENATSTGE